MIADTILGWLADAAEALADAWGAVTPDVDFDGFAFVMPAVADGLATANLFVNVPLVGSGLAVIAVAEAGWVAAKLVLKVRRVLLP